MSAELKIKFVEEEGKVKNFVILNKDCENGYMNRAISSTLELILALVTKAAKEAGSEVVTYQLEGVTDDEAEVLFDIAQEIEEDDQYGYQMEVDGHLVLIRCD